MDERAFLGTAQRNLILRMRLRWHGAVWKQPLCFLANIKKISSVNHKFSVVNIQIWTTHLRLQNV